VQPTVAPTGLPGVTIYFEVTLSTLVGFFANEDDFAAWLSVPMATGVKSGNLSNAVIAAARVNNVTVLLPSTETNEPGFEIVKYALAPLVAADTDFTGGESFSHVTYKATQRDGSDYE
jgi:hypothetical protein